MSYIQIDLGGEKRGLKFNMYALEEYTRRMTKDIETALKNNPNKAANDVQMSQASLVYACIYSGLMGNAYAKEMEFEISFGDVVDWVDAAKNEDLEAACNALSNTERYKEKLKGLEKLVANVTEETAKKKVKIKRTKKNGF